jgi:hypothetical protein
MVKVGPPRDPEDYRNLDAYQQAVRNYRLFQNALHIWSQIDHDERVWILRQLGLSYPEYALAKAREDLHDHELNIGMRGLRAITEYPLTDHRRRIYREILARTPLARHRAVRQKEERLRALGIMESLELYGEPPGTSHPMPAPYEVEYLREYEMVNRRPVHVDRHRRRA